MKPESLGPEFIHQVVYCMENQNQEYMLNLDTLELLEVEEIDFEDPNLNTDILIDIPQWTPSDGFRVMEEFTTFLGNPLYKDKLRQAMQAGYGVFRNFKNILQEAPWLTDRWHAFKNAYMEKIVIQWIRESDTLRSMLDLEQESIPEETEDILFEDFSMGQPQPEELQEIIDFLKMLNQSSPQLIYPTCQGDCRSIEDPNNTLLVKDPLGSIVGVMECREQVSLVYEVTLVALDPRVEGIGLLEHILFRFIDMVKKRGARGLITPELPYREARDQMLHQSGFVRKSIRYEISLIEKRSVNNS